MDYKLSFNLNENLYLRDPENSDLGKKIVKYAINMIYDLGFENFTFKKLALEIGTTEASLYRYFENKQKLLLYIISWYWHYLDFVIDFRLQNIKDAKTKITEILNILTNENITENSNQDYNKHNLYQIVLADSNKVYQIKNVTEINKSQIFKPYKNLCAKIAAIFYEYNSKYLYPFSLSSSVIEISHFHKYFSLYLPNLTDNKTLIAVIGWIVALVAIKKSASPKRWVIFASILMFIVYLIPHSVLGSELDYDEMDKLKNKIEQSAE